MAEKITTTPVLMTQVINVGPPVEFAKFVLRLLRDVPRSLGELDRRLALEVGDVVRAATGFDILSDRCGLTAGTDGKGSSSSLLSSPIATDSGTSRKEDGCALEMPTVAG